MLALTLMLRAAIDYTANVENLSVEPCQFTYWELFDLHTKQSCVSAFVLCGT